MGIFGSSEERVEEKMVDLTGQVNNNIIIQEAKDTHSQLLLNTKLLYATYILVCAEIVKLSIYVYCSIKKNIKKRYLSNNKSGK